MNPQVAIALFGWIFVAILLFSWLPKRRAVLTSMIGGWMFLPVASIKLPAVPDFDKFSAACGATFFAALLTDSGRLLSIRLRLSDWPIIIWIICPFLSSMSNGLGAYDGLSATLTHAVYYGLPYWLGRVYFADAMGLRELLVAMIVGAIVYIPFCLIEIRLSPQMHEWVYGYSPIKSHMTKRLGGYRPAVFMRHGIELGLFMASATIAAWWCWRTRILQKIGGIPIGLIAVVLFVMTALCKSLNSYFITAIAFTVLFATKWTGARVFILAFAMAAPVFVTLRMNYDWKADSLISMIEKIDAERAVSFSGRIDEEGRLLNHAWKRSWLGWGGWDRNRPDDELTEKGDEAQTDSWWIIAFGKNGLVGLISIGMVLILPALLVFRRMKGRQVIDPMISTQLVTSVIVLGFAVDCLANAMVNPMYLLAIGSLLGQNRIRSSPTLSVMNPPLQPGSIAPPRSTVSPRHQ